VGVFDGIMAALMMASDEGLAPSHLVRQVIGDPDEPSGAARYVGG
jgi:hypothetical protein